MQSTDTATDTRPFGAIQTVTAWHFDGIVSGQTVSRRCELTDFPFVVGRGLRANFTIADMQISARHAQFYKLAGQLWLQDLNSSNGTFVNGKRLRGESRLQPGDIVQFARSEFVIGNAQLQSETDDAWPTVQFSAFELEDPGGASNAGALRQMIRKRQVRPHFQPIVCLLDDKTIGFESLGRGAHSALATSPIELFQLASKVGLELELSRLFRNEGVALSMDLPGAPLLFVNAHPGEVEDMSLVAEFETLRNRFPKASMVLEIHESSVADLTRMAAIRDALRTLDVGLAYDDFGAGQSRLRDLVEVPPDYLKFDMSLIRGIDRAPLAQKKLLEGLVRVLSDLDIACLAEGVERDGELDFCRNVGFRYVQGFLLGRPAPVETCMGK